MQIIATYVNYFHLCHRKLWLFANGIRMEHTSDTVAEGKLIGETTYADRPGQYTEIEVGGIKIDFYDARNKVVHEVKKSNKVEQAHIAQVKYYIYKLHQHGIEDVTGLIEYPKMRQREMVTLAPAEHATMVQWEQSIGQIIGSEHCPPLLNKPICKQCSYFDFCYVNEDDY